MDDLTEALTELRAFCQAAGLVWHDAPPREQVEATLTKFDIPTLPELVTWFSLCGPGTFVTPHAAVTPLAEEAGGYDELRLVGTEDGWDPDDLSQVADWLFLTHIEIGGIALWVGPSDGPRPLIWRDEVWRTMSESLYPLGLTCLVHEWIHAWRAGRYTLQPGPHAQPTFVDAGPHTQRMF